MEDQIDDHGYQDYQHLKAKKMKYEAKPDVIALTHKSKHLYPLFSEYELKKNRFHSIPDFAHLETEILTFNQELQAWKHNDKEVKNIFLTYHLYQNLFSRMKYISSLVLDRQQAQRGYADIAKWFHHEKPKVRNKIAEKETGQMKPSTATKETESEIDTLLISNTNKRELKPYEMMARTSHNQFFPPKERLLQYKRKDFLEGLGEQTQRRALSVSNINKAGMTRYKNSLATTRTTFFKTATQLTKKDPASEIPVEPVVPPFEVDPVKEENLAIPVQQVDLQQIEKEKQVQQEELLQENIVQVVNEEDQAEPQQDIFSQQEKVGKRYRRYMVDPSAEDETIAAEKVKDIQQSTLKRILKEKEQTVKRKLEQLSLGQQMTNWGAIKSRRTTDEHRKLQRKLLANKYTKLQYVPKTFEEKKNARKNDIPQFQAFYRSKSSYPGTIEQEVQKLKINSALKTYGKYINHVNIVPIHPETQDEKDQMRMMRSTSLTSFCRQGKKAPFSQITTKYGVQSHNEDVMNGLHKIKDRLAKTSIPAEKKEILMAMGVVDPSKMDLPDSKAVYPPHKQLLNNPFFPKHLFQTKPKKKKK